MGNMTFIKVVSITTEFFKLPYKITLVITTQDSFTSPFPLHGNIKNDLLHFCGSTCWCSFCCLYLSNSSQFCFAELKISCCFLQMPAFSAILFVILLTCSFRLLYLRLMRHSVSGKKLLKSTLSCTDKLITTIKCLYIFRNDCWLSPLSTLSLIKDCRGKNNQLLATYFY